MTKIGVALRSEAPEEPTHEHRCIRWLSEEPTPWYFGAKGNRSQVSLYAPDEPMVQKGASVHRAYYVPETLQVAQESSLQHRLNR